MYESEIRLGHPSWISGPLMEKLPVSRGEIAFGFPPILWPDFRLGPTPLNPPKKESGDDSFCQSCLNVIHREIARSKLQINSKLKL